MKMRIFTMMLLLVGFAFNSYATNPISPNAMDFEKTMKVEKMNKATKLVAKFAKTKVGKWVAKKAVQATKIMNKLGIDLSDPVQKWLWYAIFGIVGGSILWALGLGVSVPLLWTVAYLVYLGGVICFWYWVYLKFLK